MTRIEIEAGNGRYPARHATIIQRGAEDVFETAPAESGWRVGAGWHVAGSMTPAGRVEWCDLWEKTITEGA